MRTFLILASFLMLSRTRAEPPTSYSRFQSFQPVPSVSAFSINSGSSQSASNSYGPPSSAASQSYGAPSASSTSQGGYGAPSAPKQQQQQRQPKQSYGAPSSSSQSSYSPPTRSSSSYGAPSAPSQSNGGYSNEQELFQQQSLSYAAPSYTEPQQQQPQQQQQQQQPSYHAQSQPANVQVSYGAPPNLPPGSSYGPPPIVTGAGPDNDIEYRIVYKPVKAPKPDLVLPPPPPRQKTIVYILVPRIEPPEPIIVPTHAPTAPSKPEVYFIRYKAPKKNKSQQQPSSGYGAPSGQYGAPSAPKPVVIQAPTKKREVEKVSVTSSVSASSAEEVRHASNTSFGQKVNKRSSFSSAEDEST